MTEVTLNNLASLSNETTALTTINSNTDAIETAFEDTLSRSGGAGLANSMVSNLDMNGNQILNLPPPATGESPARLFDLQNLSTIQTFKVGLLPTDVRTAGCVCDGTTDDTAALNAALATGGQWFIPANKQCYVTGTIYIPSSTELCGQTFFPGAPALGSGIIASANVSPVVQLGTSVGSLSTQSLRKLVITRQGSTPSTSLIGIQGYGYNNILEDVGSFNHGVGFDLGPNGIAFTFTRVYAGMITDAYMVVDTAPELRVSQGRFGMNGSADYVCNTFLRFKGGGSSYGSGQGPNTVIFENVQFNQGYNPVANWMQFVNLGSGASGQTIFQFTDCHAENFSSAGIYSDSSWTNITNLILNGCTYSSDDNSAFFALNAATSLTNLRLKDNIIYDNGFTLAPTNGLSGIVLNGNYFGAAVTINPGSNNSGAIVNNIFYGATTIEGAWQILNCIGNNYSNGVTISINPYGAVYSDANCNISNYSNSASNTYSFTTGGTIDDKYVRSRVMNKSTANGSSAGFEIDTGITNSYYITQVMNNTGTPSVVHGSGSAIASEAFSMGGNSVLTLTPNYVQLYSQTYSALPAATSGYLGAITVVTDSTTETWGATISGGGSYNVLAFCDGSNWTVFAK